MDRYLAVLVLHFIMRWEVKLQRCARVRRKSERRESGAGMTGIAKLARQEKEGVIQEPQQQELVSITSSTRLSATTYAARSVFYY